MRAEDRIERQVELEGWPVYSITYRLGQTYYAEIECGATRAKLARAQNSAREDAEREVFETASRRLRRTRRIDVPVQ